MHSRMIRFAVVPAVALLAACGSTQQTTLPISAIEPEPAVDRAAEARAFVDSVEAVLLDLSEKAGRAAWVQATYIIYDTEILAAEATEEYLSASVEFATRAADYLDVQGLSPEVSRKLQI
ncbi:MAG: hypothetical protein R3314_03605, partial [Longimicrobiales bacterium]|nr:hypothetical protein [Longimicrobiales bacterium]